MLCKKNEYEFSINTIQLFCDREQSKKMSEKKNEKVIVVAFLVAVTEHTGKATIADREIRGNIEYSMLQTKFNFFTGFYMQDELTLVNESLDTDFNNTIKNFFKEDCDFEEMMILQELDPELRSVINVLKGKTKKAYKLVKELVDIAGGIKETKRIISKIE